MNKDKFNKKLSNLLFYTSILIFIIAFNFSDNPTGGWYLQILPDVNGGQLADITFVDSLTGFGIIRSPGYILKTTNGGDNWVINYSYSQPFYGLQFINKDTGYVLSFNRLLRTIDSGDNWWVINLPTDLAPDNIWVLNNDTIWAAMSEGLVGGIFLTTNAGASWTRNFSIANNNPEKIYFYNKDLGFATNGNLLRTSNGGSNWNVISGGGDFYDIQFIDSLTGWKAFGTTMKKTTDGGLNWLNQNLPPKGGPTGQGHILLSRIERFSLNNKDTLWGVGSEYITSGFLLRGAIYKTTNGGNNWGFQIPDTNINIEHYNFVDFDNILKGWSYSRISSAGGVHTITGGNDTTFYVDIKQTSSEIPSSFVLKQNYPNPFNPTTTINYSLKVSSHVKLRIFNSIGEEVQSLVSQRQNAGEYEIEFDGSGLNSGVYFYKLEVSDNKSNSVFSETKKMLLVK